MDDEMSGVCRWRLAAAAATAPMVFTFAEPERSPRTPFAGGPPWGLGAVVDPSPGHGLLATSEGVLLAAPNGVNEGIPAGKVVRIDFLQPGALEKLASYSDTYAVVGRAQIRVNDSPAHELAPGTVVRTHMGDSAARPWSWVRVPGGQLQPVGAPLPMEASPRLATLDLACTIEADVSGDLLVEYADKVRRPLVFKLVDRDAFTNRWLLFRVGRRHLDNFCAGVISARRLLHLAQSDIDVVDLNGHLRCVRWSTVPLAVLPSAYIPAEGAMHRAHLAPDVSSHLDAAGEIAIERRTKKIVQASLGPLGHAILDVLYDSGWMGLTIEALQDAVALKLAAEEDSVHEHAVFTLYELHDRHLVHRAGPGTGIRWCWGKDPRAIARELACGKRMGQP